MKNFSKVFFSVLILALLFVGCKTAEPVVEDIPVAKPVVEETVAAPEPAVEEAKEPLNVEIEAYGMKFTATRLAPNQLIITVPADLAEADAVDFMTLCAKASPEYFAPLQYAIGEGYVILIFPYEFTDEEIIAFAEPLAQALIEYVPARVKYYADLDAAAKAAAEAAAQAAQEAAAKAAAEAQAAAEKAAAEKAAAEKAAAEKAAAEKAAAEKAAAEKAAAEKAAAEKAAAEKAAQEAAAKAAAEKAAAEAEAAKQVTETKKSGAGTVILIIVLVLLAAACVYYFLVFRKKGTK